MDEEIVKMFGESKSLSDVFEVVKEAVRKVLNKSRGGLDLGLVELDNAPQGLLGAYYNMGSNMIVMNGNSLRRVRESSPELLRPYMLSVLMHEYLHSLGIMSDEEVRGLAVQVCLQAFGEENIITQISKDMTKFFPGIIYPAGAPQGMKSKVRLVKDFDKSDTGYIG